MKYLAAITLVLSVATISGAAEPSYKQNTKAVIRRPGQSPVIEKAFISFRIGSSQWMPENRYQELLALFEKHKGVTDEITFFTSTTHAPLPLKEVKHRCEILAKRMSQARALGYRVGINPLTTIGHHEENLPNSLSGDYTHATDINGNISRGCFCPNDPRFLEYVRELYRLVAGTSPDYIWIDDDVRLAGHLPIVMTCFCGHCLATFEKESGTKYTRASLAKALLEGPEEPRMAVRKAWLAHNRATIGRLLTFIERTVHEVKPGLPLGMMTGDRWFEGYDFDRWAEALAGPAGAPVYWRPGGSYYNDSWTGGLTYKSHAIGRQIALLPPSVLSIQSEIENFPYQRLKKAAHITVVEAASHMGAGCTGAAFNVFSMNDEPLDEYDPLVARIHQARPFYDLMAKHLGRTEPVGVSIAWNKDVAVAADLVGGNWINLGSLVFPGEAPAVWEIGIPAAYNRQGSAVTLLFKQTVATMPKDQITKLLSSGVYMDTEALIMLNRMGFQELTGLEFDKSLPVDCIEELTAHPLNGSFAGRQRDCRQSFYAAPGLVLKKLDPKAETLASLVDYSGKETAATSMAVFENRLGGRVCVSGYFPWAFLHSLSKTTQMKSVMRWLSRDQLPAYVASYHKVNLWARQPSEGHLAIALLNGSFDPADQLVLALLTQANEIKVIDMDCNEQVVRESGRDGPYRRFAIPRVEPWSARLVIAGE